MKRDIVRYSIPAVVVAVGAFLFWANAGDLNPPPGPVAPTMKNLDAVEPRTPITPATTPGDDDSVFKITAPGSYYLMGNVVVSTTKHGIEIESDNVTIDLRGFSLEKVGGGFGEGVHVNSDPTRKNIEVRNGTVHGWSVCVEVSNASNVIVRDIRASIGGGIGIDVGVCAQVVDCVVLDCVDESIRCMSDCLISRCVSRRESGAGAIINVLGSRNRIDGNHLTGYPGDTGPGGQIGIRVDVAPKGSATFRNNVIVGNTISEADSGIIVNGNGNRIEGNTIIAGDALAGTERGIQVIGVGNLILKNAVRNFADPYVSYDIEPSNAYGPIVNVAGVGSIVGTTDADHPWANFQY